MLCKANEKCVSSLIVGELRLCTIAKSNTGLGAGRQRSRALHDTHSRSHLKSSPVHSEPPYVLSILKPSLVLSTASPVQEPTTEPFTSVTLLPLNVLFFLPHPHCLSSQPFPTLTFSLAFLATSPTYLPQ